MTGGGNATTEAVTLSRGSGAEGPSRGHHGLQLQCTEIAGDENTAQEAQFGWNQYNTKILTFPSFS